MDGTDPETAEKIQIENLSKTYTLQFYATHKLLTPTHNITTYLYSLEMGILAYIIWLYYLILKIK